jgi:hypothetical protein
MGLGWKWSQNDKARQLAAARIVADLVGDVILFGRRGSTSYSLGITGVSQPWYILASLVEIAVMLAWPSNAGSCVRSSSSLSGTSRLP